MAEDAAGLGGARLCGLRSRWSGDKSSNASLGSSRLPHAPRSDGDPAIGTSPFDHDGDYGFDNSDVFDQKVPVATPSRLLDRYGAPTRDAEDVLDDAQPPKAFVQSAPLAFHADDESDGEDSDGGSGSHAARAVRKAEYSSDDDSEEEEEEEEDAEYDLSETESVQSRSSDEELDMDGSSSDDDDDDDDEEQVFPEAWSDGDDE